MKYKIVSIDPDDSWYSEREELEGYCLESDVKTSAQFPISKYCGVMVDGPFKGTIIVLLNESKAEELT